MQNGEPFQNNIYSVNGLYLLMRLLCQLIKTELIFIYFTYCWVACKFPPGDQNNPY